MVFSTSGLLAALRTIVLFSWQVAHRSVMGFMTVRSGQYFLQMEVNVENFTTLTAVCDEASTYTVHT